MMVLTGLRRLLKLLCYSTPPLAEHQYTYSQVKKITKKFKRVVGKGKIGVVYHGEVAVKMLNSDFVYNTELFTAEVHDLLELYHRSLVRLIGYCHEGEHLALIYEFMANGNLEDHLSGRFGTVLSWETRLKISIAVAQGLLYLHTGSSRQIIHKSIKPTNILFDRDFKVHLADYGLSRCSSNDPEGQKAWKIYVNPGRSGYLDNRYFALHWLDVTSDVYSFGIVLLKMITNQPVIDNNRETPHISKWVDFKVKQGEIREIVDPKLNNDFEINSVSKTIELALACADHTAAKRPHMGEVFMMLKECLNLEMAPIHGRTGQITQDNQ